MTKQTVLTYDKRKEGWKLLEHAPRRIISTKYLELVSFFNEEYKEIDDIIGLDGDEIVRRARALDANCSQEDAEWFLEHQGKIPAGFRHNHLVFTGTIWESEGKRCVPVLYNNGKRRFLFFHRGWFLLFHGFDLPWDSTGRLVRLRK